MPLDPDAIRSQPALTTSSGRIWLIVGGLFAAVSLAVLIPMLWLASVNAAVGIVLVVGLYVFMIVIRVVVAPGRRRLGLLATGMLAMAVAALVTTASVLLVSSSPESLSDLLGRG